MIIVDANILLYAYDRTSSRHKKAKDWIEQVFSGTVPVGLPWNVISAFLRIITNPRLPGERLTAEDAVNIVDSWLAQPNVSFLGPTDNHWPLFRKMLVEGQGRGDLVTDADLAALTIEHGGVLQSTDRDFARFPGLRWTNPLP